MVASIDNLIAKLRRIEALHAGAATAGEAQAADHARQRIMDRLAKLQSVETPTEYRLSLPDPWARQLFIALARRYGLRPFRYRRQRHSTVMLRALPSFMDGTLWPEFEQFSRELRSYLQTVTDQVIAEAIHGDGSDLEEEARLALPE